METVESISVRLTHPDAIIPKRATAGSAGYDLAARLDHTIRLQPGERVCIGTGLAIELPEDVVLLICSRSGSAVHQGLCILNDPGIIDSDYRGEVHLILHNASFKEVTIHPGDRVAQALFVPVFTPKLVGTLEPLSLTARGTNGLGSSGK